MNRDTVKICGAQEGTWNCFSIIFYLVTTSYHKIPHSHELASHYHKLIYKSWYEIPRCGNEMLSYGNEILLSCWNEMLSRGNEILICV